MRNLYLKILQKLCRIEVNRVLNSEQIEFGARALIQYHDFVAAQCVGSGEESAKKVMKLSVATSNMIEYGPRGKK